MANDIVKQLRDWKRAADGTGLGSLLGIFDEAADEIERLRRNTGCARNQSSTQFCAEAVDGQRDVETLKAELARNADECRETLTELRQRVETLTDENERLRAELRSYTGDGHTIVEPFVPEAL